VNIHRLFEVSVTRLSLPTFIARLESSMVKYPEEREREVEEDD